MRAFGVWLWLWCLYHACCEKKQYSAGTALLFISEAGSGVCTEVQPGEGVAHTRAAAVSAF
jgi:hypothetical protein